MTRIPYLADDTDEPAELVAAIRKRRGGGLLNLDRILLYSPPLAQGWNALFGAIRTGLDLDPHFGELAICVVAVLNGADYEFHHHAPVWKQAGGRDDQIAALSLVGTDEFPADLFSDADGAVIALTIAMTRQVSVPNDVFTAARAVLPSDRHMVELVATIAGYNLVSRLLVAVGIEPE